MHKLIITAASGVEGVTKRELKSLGIAETTAINGKISFFADEELIAKANLHLRTADKVLLVIKEFSAESFDELFDNAEGIPWEDYFPRNGKFNISGKSTKSKLFALSSIQSILKKAILTRLGKHYKTSYFPESGTEYHIDFNIYEDSVTLSLNTSGASLHKRGYRTLVGAAPLRETLASCMVLLSRWNGETPLIDPFCGSGTIPIEAARIALNIPAGMDRRFAFEDYGFIDASVLETEKQKALSEVKTDLELRISGFDIDKEAIKLALRHARNANLESRIHFQVQDMRNLSSRFSNGTIITNPPYGERLLTPKAAALLYKDFRKVYDTLEGWSLFVLTSAPDFERSFGKRADKNRKLYNAKKECKLYSYL